MMKADMDTLQVTKDKVWAITEILQKEPLLPYDYHILLFLISLHREDLFADLKDIESYNRKWRLDERIEEDLLEHNETFEQLYDGLFNGILERLSYEGFSLIIDSLYKIDITCFKDNFSDIFEYCLDRLLKIQGKFQGLNGTPVEISRFASCLVELPLEAEIFNPFAGLGSFQPHFKNVKWFNAQEINYVNWAISILRSFAHDLWARTQSSVGQSASDWNPFYVDAMGWVTKEGEKWKYDLIISQPPFRMRLKVPLAGRFGTIRFAENLVIEKGLADLKIDGKLICIVREGFFSDRINKPLQEYLIENDLLETIVSFPSGLLFHTGIPFSIIVINKAKSEKGVIRMVNAHPFTEKVSRSEKVLNDSLLLAEFQKKTFSDVILKVNNQDIKDNGYNLSVLRYFNQQHSGVEIGALGAVVPGKRVREQGYGKFIRIRDLKDDVIDFNLKVEEIEVVLLPDYCRKIEESCILIATNWRNHKPTYFQYSGTAVYLSKDVIAIKIDQSLIDIAYLINELHSKEVIDQIDSYRTGVTVPNIKIQDLLKVRVVVPELVKQLEKLDSMRVQKIKELQIDRNSLAHEFTQKQFNEFASLKHTLGTPRQNILSYAETLHNFIDKNKSPELAKVNDDFKIEFGIELISALQVIKRDINFISELLEKGEQGLILEKYEIELISLSEVLKCLQDVCSHHKYNFMSLPPSRIVDLGRGDSEKLGVKINLSLLKVLLDNIFSNAHKYGFEGNEYSSEHHVVLEAALTEEGFFINILNNGKPFPKNMNKEKFIAKYSTSDRSNGTGIGGYDINRIAEYFQSDWYLRINEDPFFRVQFSFWFNPEQIK